MSVFNDNVFSIGGADQGPGSDVSIEAEQIFLSLLLRDPSVYPRVSAVVEPEDFGEPRHAALYERIGRLSQAGQPISLATLKPLVSGLPNIGELSAIAYLARLLPAAHLVPLARTRDEAIGYARFIAMRARHRELTAATAATNQMDSGALQRISEVSSELLALESGRTLRGRDIQLIPFSEIEVSTGRREMVSGLIPREGLVVLWGPPKCGKSFWIFDLLAHVALGWDYRGRRVRQGPVVYCAFEGQSGVQARAEAFRRHHGVGAAGLAVPLYLQPMTIDLCADHPTLIAAIRARLGETNPVAICLDTLNRSFSGSESKDEDMGRYIAACDAIREAFECAVIVVHHCGIEGTRPRGHTSLIGAADAQLSVKRDEDGPIVVKREFAKDGEAGERIASELQTLEVAVDEDGEPVTSCVVVPAEPGPSAPAKLTKNQETMLALLRDAGTEGLTTEEWNERARDIGIGVKRRSDLYDLRRQLQERGLIRQGVNVWRAM